jgi:hypothetical protein
MTTASAIERVALIFCTRADERYLVEFVSDQPDGPRQWRFPITELIADPNGERESPAAAARRLAKEDFGHDVNPMQCHGLQDYVRDGFRYHPILVRVANAGELSLPPGGVAEWKTFPALVLIAEHGLFPPAHLALLNTAEEHLQEDEERNPEEDDDPDPTFTEL